MIGVGAAVVSPGLTGTTHAATIAELFAGDSALVAPATATPLPALQGLPALCVGDCGGDHVVTVNEVVTGVAIALGLRPVSACLNLDADHDGRVVIAELIAAVAHLLGGCGGTSPTPTATPSGDQSVCGGPVTSVPKICNLQITPARVRRNASISIGFGISDLEGDVDTLCAGTGLADAGTPALQCTGAQPAGMPINVAGTIGPFPVTLPIGHYVFALQFRDAAGHVSELLTAEFEVFQLRM